MADRKSKWSLYGHNLLSRLPSIRQISGTRRHNRLSLGSASYLASTYSDFKFEFIFDTVGTDVSALYVASPAYLQPEGIFLDVAGAVHIMDNVKSALTTVVGIINRTVRPTFLGGTPRKYLPITFWATSMVCSTVLHSVTGSFLYADQRVERMC